MFFNITKFKILVLIIGILLIILPMVKEDVKASSKFNMSFVYFGDKNNYTEYVDRTGNSLNVLSPSYFDINSDGTLKITEKFDLEFIKEMHKRNKKVVPFLSNHWDRTIGRAALENRDKLTDEIVQAINEYNLDGINVDIENLTESDKKDYIDLVKMLRDKLPSEKEVSISVAANPKGLTIGWHGSYDYSELSKYCDYLLIMAYDESYFGSLPGPVASISFVEESIKYALKRVPAEKIVLGIPYYGRYWNLSETKGGYGIDLNKIRELVKKYNGEIVFDSKSKSPKAVFTINYGDEKSYVYGRELKPGRYVVWFENQESIKEKLILVQKYNLKGTGSWSLGQEIEEFWEFYELWLNGHYFTDIRGHWAEDYILAIEKNGWMKGTSKDSFSPDESLTRAQAAVILVRILNLENLDVDEEGFNDVPNDYWASKEIKMAKEHGMINGIGNGKFAPEQPVTREQMAVMIDRLLNKNENVQQQDKNPYIDVSTSDWAYESIINISGQGILNGFADGTFKPKEIMTRGQMATLLYRISPNIEQITK